MAVVPVTAGLEKLKKIRSLDEIKTRGAQALSAYRDQRKATGELPTDEKFFRSINASQFKGTPIIAETLWQRFYQNGRDKFFASFNDAEGLTAFFRETFGGDAARHFVDAAELIVAGRVDLVGLKGVYVGSDVDWHREPISAKRSPEKYWKEFDDLDVAETGNKKILWELNRHQHFFTLGVAYWLTGDERFAQVFAYHLESWIYQNPPGIGVNWSSSLEVAYRAMSWVWAFHFFEESEALTPELFKLALKSLYCHGRHIEKYLSKYYSPNTHLTGEALGLYYLGTQFPFLDRASKWKALGEDILFAEIEKQILEDGVYFEQSTWYQRYTLDIYSQFIILKSHQQGVFERKTDTLESRLARAFEFLVNITSPDARTPLIGDDDGGRLLPLTTAAPDDFRGSAAVGALTLGLEEVKYLTGENREEIFWLGGPAAVRSYDAISEVESTSQSRAFENGGYFVMRDGWTETDNSMVIDCGPVGALSGGHGHADTLSFVASAHGKPLLVDSGTYTYHESKELRDYFRSSTAHNTLEVDGSSSSIPGRTFNWETRADATLQKWIAEERFDYFSGSHNGYKRLSDPVIHTRDVLFLKGDYWIVIDTAEARERHKYALNFHVAEGRDTTIGYDSIGGRDHRIFTFGDNGRWEQKEAWISTIHGNRRNAPFFRFVSTGEGRQEFFSFILPFDGGVAPVVEETPMHGGRAFFIRYAGYTDIFLTNDEPGRVIDNGIFVSDFRLAWARLREGESRPDEIVLIDGVSMMMGETAVVKDGPCAFASARRFGDDVYVKTDLGRTIVTLR
jgi:hypothetical protein